jgi:nucleotide-binding universal stress UspA family protein
MTNENTLSPLRIVLIGSSLEEDGDQIVRTGLAVARAAGARVHLVHAARIDPLLLDMEAGLGPDFMREEIAWRKEELDGQIKRLAISEPELAGVTVQAGAPHQLLTNVARTVGAGLIVIGATGSGPLAAELLGSTAERVVRKAACPVLLVRGELPIPPRRVLAPVDLSSLSGDAFRCGLHLLAQLSRSEEIGVRAVYALSFLDAVALRHRKSGGISFEQVERCSAEELRRFVLENRTEGPCHVETTVLPGEARFEILREVAEHPVDLIVLGTHGRGGLDRLVLGSVAATVARKAPCSVLLISPEATLEQGIADAVTSQTMPAWHRETVSPAEQPA